MSKSVLIVDAPKSCSECLFREMSHCIVTQEMIDKINCPLSPLPDPINLKQYTDNTVLNMDNILAYQYVQGYNDFREEILKRTL